MSRPCRSLALVAVAVAVAVVAGAGLLSACGSDSATVGGGGPVVVATTTQVGDRTREGAGTRAGVRQILSANSDPHAYEPRPSDVRAVTGAQVVVRSGADLDDWLGGVLDNAGSDARALDLIDSVRTRRGEGGVDPHWWQDPRNAEIAVGRIRDALIAADPAGRATYSANAAAYLARLRRLDRAIAVCMAAIPAARRRLVTDHDALGYYADRYGIEVIGTVIPALSTQAQASAGAVARLVRTIRRAGVTTIYTETSANAQLSRAIARDAGATVGPPLYADSLGPQGSAGATYIGSLRANTRALAKGFSGGRARCDLPR
jgi:ABC-type Zn uptake system ZnuABC Zn-binding protein ZnuA